MKAHLSSEDIDRIIQMAWEDRTPFEAIESQFGLKQADVIRFMRTELKSSSFKLWRTRTNGQQTKHTKLRSDKIDRFKCSWQKSITHNKISKR
jgi:uncharacterized protein (TIGR03643 family)